MQGRFSGSPRGLGIHIERHQRRFRGTHVTVRKRRRHCYGICGEIMRYEESRCLCDGKSHTHGWQEEVSDATSALEMAAPGINQSRAEHSNPRQYIAINPCG